METILHNFLGFLFVSLLGAAIILAGYLAFNIQD